jgi:hypothetical protein
MNWLNQLIKAIEGPYADLEQTLTLYQAKHGSYDDSAAVMAGKFKEDHSVEDLDRFPHKELTTDLVAGALSTYDLVC